MSCSRDHASMFEDGWHKCPECGDKLSSGITRGLGGTPAKPEPPGQPLNRYPAPYYGLKEHARRFGDGVCLLRTAKCAQPAALQIGDVLATGCEVLSAPREGYNGRIWIHLTGGFEGHWIEVPGRIPIALQGGK